jgi:hypothetical protein
MDTYRGITILYRFLSYKKSDDVLKATPVVSHIHYKYSYLCKSTQQSTFKFSSLFGRGSHRMTDTGSTVDKALRLQVNVK